MDFEKLHEEEEVEEEADVDQEDAEGLAVIELLKLHEQKG
jgi:hypothetical protein